MKYELDEFDISLFFWILRHVRKQDQMDCIFEGLDQLKEMNKRRDIWEEVFRKELGL